jgi:protoporphyrinogen oxidase
MANLRKVLIVGGGLTGLSAAYELSHRPGFEIRIVESGAQLGGLAGGFKLLGTTLEKSYHHLFLGDTSVLGLIRDVGLWEQLVWHESAMGIYRGGRIYPFTTPWDLLRFEPCGLAGRVRLGLVALYLKHTKNWHRFSRLRASEWMARACGQEAMEAIWTPLLRGKFDRYHDSISMAWLWARIHSRAQSRTTGGGGERLGYLQGGFGILVSRLEAELSNRKVQIQMGASVEAFSGQDRSAIIQGKRVGFDACVFTGSCSALRRLLPSDAALEDYSRSLGSIEYLSALSLVFVSEQEIGDCYWLNINEPGAPFLVFVRHTRLVDKGGYQGKQVYYIGAYAPPDSRLCSLTDTELTDLWWRYLQRIFPEFNPDLVLERHIFRLPAAQHIVDTGYEARIPSCRTPLPGVFLANFSQVFPQDRGVNWAVSEGTRIARTVLQELVGSG